MLALFFYAGSSDPILLGAESPDIISRDPGARTVTVQVTGVVESSRGNLAEALRRDACRKAIEQVVGFQIVSRTFAANNIVKDFTDVKLDGFITECKSRTGIKADAGVSTQEFAITVKTGEVNKELLAQKIDVRILYDVVSRPRICVAIEDKVKDAPQADWDITTTRSSGRIIEYFKRLNPRFDFLNPSMMRRNTADTLDAVALEQAASGSYNILVSGSTRIEAIAERNPTPVRPDLKNPFEEDVVRYVTTVSWQVTDVATKGTILAIHDQTDELTSKTKVWDRNVTNLFRDMMAYWNETAFGSAWQIMFSSSSSAKEQDTDSLLSCLKRTSGLDAETIKMAGKSKGKVTYTAIATGDLAEIQGALEKLFKGKYNIVKSQPGLIELAAVGASAVGSIAVGITNISVTQADKIERQLKALPEVGGLDEGEFRGGRSLWNIKSSLTARELGLILERTIIGITVSDYSSAGETPARLEAKFEELKVKQKDK